MTTTVADATSQVHGRAGRWLFVYFLLGVAFGITLVKSQSDGVMGGGSRDWIGGTIFGLGWALTGACPGPLFALIGSGVTVMSVAVLSALAGTWVYEVLRPSLPH